MHMRNKHNRHNAKSADQQSELTPGVDAVPVVHTKAGQPAARDRTKARCGVNDDQRVLHLAEIKTIVIVEEFGQIEEIKPPHWVSHTLCNTEAPETSVAQKDRVDRSTLRDGCEVGLSLRRSTAELVVGE